MGRSADVMPARRGAQPGRLASTSIHPGGVVMFAWPSASVVSATSRPFTRNAAPATGARAASTTLTTV
ncbi:MAG TPA: hypothetical protein VG871_00225 [Vicinamibacterales bacterium]|nr:hypothetical protein [Vicinamibacterales bacterium]